MSYDMVEEDVPPFQVRVGDYAVHGSNNSSLILGRDRAKNGPATVDDGLGTVDDGGKGKGTGVAHLVAGRKDKNGDPDFSKDMSFLYLAMKTKLDDNLNISTKGDAKVPKDNDVPAGVMKSDNVRVMFRKNAMIVIEDSTNFVFVDKDSAIISIADGKNYIKVEKDKTTMKIGSAAKVVIDGGGKKVTIDVDKSGKIELSEGAANHILQAEAFLDKFDNHKHPTGVGPSGPPLVPLKPQKDQLASTGASNKPEIVIP
jgi:hypothetical protein